MQEGSVFKIFLDPCFVTVFLWLCLCAHVQHRFVFASSGSDPSRSSPVQGVLRIDTEAGTEQQWLGEPHEYVGEVVFAPRTSASGTPGTSYNPMPNPAGSPQ